MSANPWTSRSTLDPSNPYGPMRHHDFRPLIEGVAEIVLALSLAKEAITRAKAAGYGDGNSHEEQITDMLSELKADMAEIDEAETYRAEFG